MIKEYAAKAIRRAKIVIKQVFQDVRFQVSFVELV